MEYKNPEQAKSIEFHFGATKHPKLVGVTINNTSEYWLQPLVAVDLFKDLKKFGEWLLVQRARGAQPSEAIKFNFSNTVGSMWQTLGDIYTSDTDNDPWEFGAELVFEALPYIKSSQKIFDSEFPSARLPRRDWRQL